MELIIALMVFDLWCRYEKPHWFYKATFFIVIALIGIVDSKILLEK